MEDINLDEVDLQPAKYQIWVLDSGSDFESCIGNYDDADEAVMLADLMTREDIMKATRIPCYVSEVDLVVETVIDLGGYEENTGDIFRRTFKLN